MSAQHERRSLWRGRRSSHHGHAAVNRYVLTSRATAGDQIAARRLAYSSVTELLIALVVLGLVTSSRFTSPPRAVLAAAETAVHAHIQARATSGHVATAPPRSVMKSRRLMSDIALPPLGKVVTYRSSPNVGILIRSKLLSAVIARASTPPLGQKPQS